MALLEAAERAINAQDAARLLSEAFAQEKAVDADLQSALDRREQVQQGLGTLKNQLGLLQLIGKHADTVTESTRQAAELAERVSCRVRELDASQSRVSRAINRLNSIEEAAACAESFQDAIAGEDYSMAAKCLNRFAQLYAEVSSKSANGRAEAGEPAVPRALLSVSEMDEQGHVLSDQAKSIKAGAEELRKIVLDKFEAASREGDHEKVKHFASILGPIGLAESGAAAFTKYLVGLVSSRAQQASDRLLAGMSAGGSEGEGGSETAGFCGFVTDVYRDVVEAVEANAEMVVSGYGEANLAGVAMALHGEAESRAVSAVHKFLEFRAVGRIAGRVQGEGSTGSMADVKFLEKVIEEIVHLSVRTEEYLGWLKQTLLASTERGAEEAAVAAAGLPSCPLNLCVQELHAYYTSLEETYMDRTTQVAIQLDESMEGALTTSVVDDTFFILQKCGRRALATGNAQCLCSVLNNVNNLLCNTFMHALAKEEGAYDVLACPPSEIQDLGDDMQAEIDHRRASVNRAAQAVNDVQVSAEYIEKLRAGLEGYVADVFHSEDDRKRVRSCLSDLTKASSDFERLCSQLIEQISQKVTPKLRGAVDALGGLSFKLSEAEYSMQEAEDVWVSQLLERIEDHVQWLADVLSAKNHGELVHSVLGNVTKRIEAILLQKKFNQLGGLTLDRDIRNMVSYTSNLTERTVRDKFARLLQVATLLNLDSPREVLDYWGENSGSMVWRLTPFEMKRVLKLRVDFNPDDIDELNLN